MWRGVLRLGFGAFAFFYTFSLAANAVVLKYTLLNFVEHFGVLTEEDLDVFSTLPNALTVVAVPSTRLLNDAGFYPEIEKVTFTTDSLAIHDVEFGFAERWSHLVLYDLHSSSVTHDTITILDGPDAADIDSLRSVELQCVSTGRGFWAPEHDSDLHSDLVDEKHSGAAAVDASGQLTECL